MKKQNLFDGSDALQNTVLKALGYDKTVEELSIYEATQPFLSSSFHYLTLRFGKPSYQTHWNLCGWDFRVKEFTIRVCIYPSFLQFIVFGNLHKAGNRKSPADIHEFRLKEQYRDKLYDYFGDTNPQVEATVNDMLLKKHNVESTEEYNALDSSQKQDFLQYIIGCNSVVMGFYNEDYEAFKEKYGTEYSNSYTRFALHTLKLFIHNLLSPIFIDGHAMNIKGFSDECEEFFKYENNIKIEKIERD